jgi:hypothetical protein
VRVAVQPADGLGQAMSAGHVGQAGRDELNPDRVGQPGRLHTRIGDQHDPAHA